MSVDRQFQRRTCTDLYRNPGLFMDLQRCLCHIEQPRILSFGCSDGSECLTIRHHFHTASILGCDLNSDALDKARENTRQDDIELFESSPQAIADRGPYDAILAFSVFCQWPLDDDNNLADQLPFKEVETAVAHLVDCLKPGGVLGLFNSAYFAEDMGCMVELEPVTACHHPHNGFVFKHLPNGAVATTTMGRSAHVVHQPLAPLAKQYDFSATYWRKPRTLKKGAATMSQPAAAMPTGSTPRRVGLLAPPHTEVQRSFEKTTLQLWPATDNLGNCLFRYAVATHLGNYVYVHEGTDPQWVRENVDVLCLPLANFLSPYATNWINWKTTLARFLEACDLPIIVVGMGAQAPNMTTARLALLPETVRCAQIIAAHATAIGVRGEFTADVLASIGIRNVEIIGCPSHFIAQSASIGRLVEAKYQNDHPGRIAVSGNDLRDDPLTILVQQKLLQYVRNYRGFYVCQAPEDLVALARGRFDEVPPDKLERFRTHLAPQLTAVEFFDVIRGTFLSFVAVESWLEFLSACDLFVGMRIHGAIAAMQASIPAVCIAHDSRTQELCRTLAIPSVSLQGVFEHKSLIDMFARTGFDGAAFDRNRIALARRYKSLFDNANVSCRVDVL